MLKLTWISIFAVAVAIQAQAQVAFQKTSFATSDSRCAVKNLRALLETKKLNYSVKFIKDSDWWLTKGYEFAVINQENGAVYQGWITFKEMVYGSDDEGNHLYRCTWVSSCQKNENLSIHDESGSEILNDRSFCN